MLPSLSIASSLSPLLFLLLTACRGPSVPHAEHSGCRPTCAGARVAAVGDPGASLRGAPVRPAPTLESASERTPSTAAYLCPMHLAIGSDGPGRCPECGMTLVPRAQALEHDHGN